MSEFNPSVGPIKTNGKSDSIQSPQSVVAIAAAAVWAAAGYDIVVGLNYAVNWVNAKHIHIACPRVGNLAAHRAYGRVYADNRQSEPAP